MHSGTIRKYATGSRGSPPQCGESWLNLLKKKAERKGSWLSQPVLFYPWGWESEADPAKSLFMRAEKIVVPLKNVLVI